jgi:hypothetical protein
MHCLKAAFGAGDAGHPPSRDRLGEALEMLRAEIRQLEQPAQQTPGRLADGDATRLGEPL